MRHKQLRAFHAVALEGSFTKAAELLCLTQPALTVQVRNLEKEYGVLLFERHAQTVQLTPQGQALFTLTQQLFSVEQQIKDQLDSSQNALSGQLRLGTDNPYTAIMLAAKFQQHFPAIDIELTPGNSRQVTQDLVQKKIDLALITNPTDDPRIGCIPLQDTHLHVLVSASPEWKARTQISLTELKQHPLLAREVNSNTQKLVERIAFTQNIELNYQLRLGNRELLKEAVAAGLGVGFVMSGEVGHDPRLHSLKLEGETQQYQDNLLYRLSDRHRTIIIETLKLASTS